MKKKVLTVRERLDRHNAYHVSGMMERRCQLCTEDLIKAFTGDTPEQGNGK